MTVLLAILAAAAATTTPVKVANPPPPPGTEASPTTPAQRIAKQKEMMAKWPPYFDGLYVGKSTAYPVGQPPVQGEAVHRVGSFLDGTIKVMEGRNYAPGAADPRFNGMIVVFYDTIKQTYAVRGFANGLASGTDITKTPTGYYFDAPIEGTKDFRRINIYIRPDSWGELVEIHSPGKAPVKGFEMTLRRVGEASFPPIYPRPTER